MTFAELALICAVALVGPLLSLQRLLRVPVIVGELAVGFALGVTGLNILEATDTTFSFLAEIGFGLVMFVAGSHMPMRDRRLLGGVKTGLLRALLVGALAVPVGFGIATAFGTGHGPLYAVLLASSSAALIMPALSGTPMTARSIIEMAPQVAVADAACIVLVPLVIDPQNAPRAGLGALVVIAVAVLVFVALRTVERRGWRRKVHEVSQERGLAFELRISLTILFSLAALAAAVHVSIMLAGFSLGLAVAAVGEPRRLAKQLFALTEGFFGPIFFVWLGASLNLRELATHPQAIALGLALGVAALVVHAVGAVPRQPLPVAVLTAAQLGVPVAAAAMGSSLGVFQPGENVALLLGAMVTLIATAVLSGRVVRLAGARAPVD